jgi:hypothetical protein
MYVCRWKDGGVEEGPHANNGMKTKHEIELVDVAVCLTLLLAVVPLLVQLAVCQNTLLFFISDE